jgi:hypothetical protein
MPGTPVTFVGPGSTEALDFAPNAAPELGVDLAALPDLDPSFPLVAGLANLGQALARRLETPRGGLFYDPNYGTDVRAWLNEGFTSDATWSASGPRSRPRPRRTSACSPPRPRWSSTRPRETLRITLSVVTRSGPFKLVLAASALTVDLLSVS